MKYFVKILGDLEQDDMWRVNSIDGIKSAVCPDCEDFSGKEVLFSGASKEPETQDYDIYDFKECQYCGSTFELYRQSQTNLDRVSFLNQIRRAQYL